MKPRTYIVIKKLPAEGAKRLGFFAFARGAGRLLDLGNTQGASCFLGPPLVRDALVLAEDGVRVARDFNRAFGRVSVGIPSVTHDSKSGAA